MQHFVRERNTLSNISATPLAVSHFTRAILPDVLLNQCSSCYYSLTSPLKELGVGEKVGGHRDRCTGIPLGCVQNRTQTARLEKSMAREGHSSEWWAPFKLAQEQTSFPCQWQPGFVFSSDACEHVFLWGFPVPFFHQQGCCPSTHTAMRAWPGCWADTDAGSIVALPMHIAHFG